MKKYLLAGGFAAVLMLGACGSDDSDEEASPSNQPASESEPAERAETGENEDDTVEEDESGEGESSE